MALPQQYQVDQITIQLPNQWSDPIDYTFGGFRFRSQIALTDLTDTDGRPINGQTHLGITLSDMQWVVHESGLMLAHHPLYFAISEGRSGTTKEAYQSLLGNYYLAGSGIEYFGDKAVLGIDPIVVDRSKGLARFKHNVLVERLRTSGDRQTLLDEGSAWFTKQGDRELEHPTYLWESREDGLKYVDVVFWSGGGVAMDAGGHPLHGSFDGRARLMKNLEMELVRK